MCGAESSKDAEKKSKSADGSGKTKSGPEPIVISIVLKMAEFDHKVNQFFSLFELYNSKSKSFSVLYILNFIFSGSTRGVDLFPYIWGEIYI